MKNMWSALSQAIYKRIREKNLSSAMESQRVVSSWQETVDRFYPGAGAHTRAREIDKNGVLRIGVKSPLWISELEGNKEALRTELERRAAYPVKKLFFFLD